MWVVIALAGCKRRDPVDEEVPLPPVVPGTLRVGAASGELRLPVGTPLSGYTGRCTCLFADAVDDRQSAYNTAFVESTGIQALPHIDVVWFDNGDDTLVWTKTDSIYSFDGLVHELERVLSEATGLDLTGKVVHSTNHSHSSWGTYSDQSAFYLGSDGFNAENFDRMVTQITDVALAARDQLQPAAIGVSWQENWDGDLVYHDRRPENDGLVVFDDLGPEQGGKDPHLAMMRIEGLDGTPIAAIFDFGMHGTVLGEDNPLASYEAGGAVEEGLASTFDTPIVAMFVQGAGGDTSPSTEQDRYAALESVGARAAPLLRAAWDATPTAPVEVRLESVSRAVPQLREDIHVDRGGEVDWRYAPFVEGAVADGQVYADDGALLSPIDEFNTEFGAAFCGTGDLDLPVGRLATDVWPYTNCMEVELISVLVNVYFKLPEGEPSLPLKESLTAAFTATRMGPIPTLGADGVSTEADFVAGFFPGETTSMYTEMWRRRVVQQTGLPTPWMVGYSQDHEGYLLLPEDWLSGGYEPDIGVWGPLAAEYLLDEAVDAVDEVLLSDGREPRAATGHYAPTVWPSHPRPEIVVDTTPEAGTRLTSPPAHLPVPYGLVVDLDVPATLPRVQGLTQLAWLGGDPAVDSPRVVLEREVDGVWTAVTTPDGQTITEAEHDILLVWVPDPLYPQDGPQTHTWWAAWQAVGHARNRSSLPLGSYRLRVTGDRALAATGPWPRATEPYEIVGPTFEVVPAALDLVVDDAGLLVSLPAHPTGFRLIALGGEDRGANPVEGPLTVTVTTPSGSELLELDGTVEGPRTRVGVTLPDDWTSVEVSDAAGNAGRLDR